MSMSKPPKPADHRRWWRRRTGRIWLSVGTVVALVIIVGVATNRPQAPAANLPAAVGAAATSSRTSSMTRETRETVPVTSTGRAAATSSIVTTRETVSATFTAPAAPKSASTPSPAATTALSPATPTTTSELTPASTKAPTPPAAQPGTALAAVSSLAVKGRGPMTGYSRDQFGQAWADTDRNGCDQRNDVLRRDLSQLTIKMNTRGCTVLTGSLRDPYTGDTITFSRGATTSSALQIDHVVALGNAWVTGAAQWTPAARQQFANDPLELLAVSGSANEQKGDGDTATWLPASKSYRCQYVARQIAVKTRYRLAVTTAELAAMNAVLNSCPLQALPIASGIPLDTTHTPTATPTPTQPPAATSRSTPPARLIPAIPTTAPPAPTAAPAQGDVYYQNCAAVRAAGKAPLHVGDPGYCSKLDRDHDGIACEN